MNKFLSLRWRHAHFLILAVYSCLFFYNYNAAYFPKISIGTVLIVPIGAALFFVTEAFLFCKKVDSAALVAFLLTLLFLAFGHFVYFLDTLVPHLLESSLAQFLMLAAGVISIAGIWRFLENNELRLESANRYLTLVFSGLLFYQAVLFVQVHGNPTEAPENVAVPALLGKAGDKSLHNLYVIVMDAYARTDTLREYFGYDNTPFLDELRKMGFSVGSSSVSNYFMSALSMSSMFNLDYVQNIGLAKPRSAFDLMPANQKLNHSKTRELLGNLGYSFVAAPTLFPPIECTEADVYVENELSYDSLIWNYLDTTALRLFIADRSLAKYRNFVLKNLDNIPFMAQGHAPAFVYTHLTLPHPPFVFLADGQPAKCHGPFSFNDGADFFRVGQSKEAYIRGYRNQAEFISRKMGDVLRQLLQNDPTDPYVILMSDHG